MCLSRWHVGVLTEQTSDLASGGSSVTNLGKVVAVKQWAPSSMRLVRIGSEEEERDRDLKSPYRQKGSRELRHCQSGE